MKILAIDDNQDFLTMLHDVVQEALPGAVLLTATSGSRGIELALAEDPDVILLDIVMPGMNGFEVCRRLKADEQLRQIPVVFLTSMGTIREIRVQALEVGAEAFLSQPVDELELVAVVRVMAKLKAANRLKQREKAELAALVAERTQELEQELTRHRQTSAALRESEERYTALFDRSLDCVFLTDFDGRFLDANQASLDLLGYQRADLPTLTFASLLTEDQLPLAFRLIEEIKTTGQQKRPAEFLLRGKDGWQFHVETQASLIYHEGEPFAIQGIARDLTARKRAEESNIRLATAVEQAAEAIIITDANGTILYANSAFEKNSGYTRAEAIGQNPRILKSGKQDADFYRKMWDVLKRGEVWAGHFINKRKEGSLYEEEATISPIRDAKGTTVSYVAVKRDVTREVELESRLRQSQKMEAFGQLAGGMAHDFNNILAVVRLQAGLVKAEQNISPQQLEFAEEIEKAALRGADLTRQLLCFSRKQSMQLQNLKLKEVVDNITRMLQRTLGEQIQLQFKFSAEALVIHADPGMIDQILLNLTVNARDAMPKGGQIIIETSAVEFDEVTATQTAEACPGSFACLSVADTGCGVPSEILPRIFEPFFTTKEAGKGTGLGLATVFGIVQQHKGWINVDSEVGRGTTFRIYLPRLAGTSDTYFFWKSLASIPGGKETILLVEDEVSVRDSLRTVLSRLGYRVLEASTGKGALEVWKKHRDEIRLLLTDLVMPGEMTGKELAEQLLHQDPKLRVIYSSGYSQMVVGKDLLLEDGINFLPKPFQTQKLGHTIRRRLDQN